jgi:hypothetical protein
MRRVSGPRPFDRREAEEEFEVLLGDGVLLERAER